MELTNLEPILLVLTLSKQQHKNQFLSFLQSVKSLQLLLVLLTDHKLILFQLVI